MASQDRSCKYIGSLTEGPSLTSGCGMACCPWTAYACKERTALRRVWQCHTQCIPISISPLSLDKARHATDSTPTTRMITHVQLSSFVQNCFSTKWECFPQKQQTLSGPNRASDTPKKGTNKQMFSLFT